MFFFMQVVAFVTFYNHQSAVLALQDLDICNMKHERVFLDELSPISKSYKVKVKVIEKGRAKPSPKKGILYQHLVLQDDKKNKMRGALFGDQIEAYKDAFVHKGEYEIVDAPIRHADPRWKKSEEELDFQMTFGRQTVIQPVNVEAGPILPDYQSIASIPRAGDPDDRYDIVGVVLYVEDQPRSITTAQDRQVFVREIVITDHSSQQPLVISVWNDLAGADCDPLSCWGEKFVVVGFTSLRATSHKGFSLASSMSTMFIHDPEGHRADALKEWALRHQALLADRQARVLDVRNPSNEKVIITLDELRHKKNTNTLQEERPWLKVCIPDARLEKVHAYLGCPNCGKSTTAPLGEAFKCGTCSRIGVISTPRITFNCEVSDDTGTYAFTTFTEDSERLFRMTAADLFRMKHTGDLQTFMVARKLLRTKHFFIQVGPTTSLSTCNVLQWCLKKVEIEDDDMEHVHPADNTQAENAVETEMATEGDANTQNLPLNAGHADPEDYTNADPLDAENAATEAAETEVSTERDANTQNLPLNAGHADPDDYTNDDPLDAENAATEADHDDDTSEE
ncbi:replication protein A 70 kDa DNA-binding subunit B-like isoform X1 [Spinacia oleracea]|uniref:Replication protein A 70 kDa DNA-binding subunit B-like isoform X1 n=2 Tax=Spinacia oleracea TaxID=3562 RepID=A0ABM3RU39_SPIOL|nr:replication protein A 70 kDa DNA-binding subunit B-like isoform X1 [Spinacia oleracea]